MAKTKALNRKSVCENIRGLSKNDRAFCGQYGTVTCYKAASETKNGKRLFKVSGSEKIRNGGSWTYTALREAIMA